MSQRSSSHGRESLAPGYGRRATDHASAIEDPSLGGDDVIELVTNAAAIDFGSLRFSGGFLAFVLSKQSGDRKSVV